MLDISIDQPQLCWLPSPMTVLQRLIVAFRAHGALAPPLPDGVEAAWPRVCFDCRADALACVLHVLGTGSAEDSPI